MDDAEYYKKAEAYSVKELREALAGIDKERYPKRYEYLISQYEMRRVNNCNLEVSDSDSGRGSLLSGTWSTRTFWFQVVFSFLYSVSVFGAIGSAHICKCEQYGSHQLQYWGFNVLWVLFFPLIMFGFFYIRPSKRTLWSNAMLAYTVVASLVWGVVEILIYAKYMWAGNLNDVIWVIAMGTIFMHFAAYFNNAKIGDR